MQQASFALEPTPPYDFDLTAGYLAYFRSRYAADTFEDGSYSRLLDLGDRLVLVGVRSTGTLDSPGLNVELRGQELDGAAVAEAKRQVAWMLSVDDDLTPFYRMAEADPYLGPS